MRYTFTLKYQLPYDRDIDELLEILGSSNCGDALAGIGLAGRIALEFSREAENEEAAVRAAIADVQFALPAATLIDATSA